MSNKKLYRCEDGMVFGVCKGLAEYLDVDPTVVRLIWALLICFAGSGLLLYIICAIVFPTKSDVMKEQEKDEDTIEVKSKEKKEKKSK